MTSKSGIQKPSVQKNPKTGRFEKIAEPKVQVETMPDKQDPTERNVPEIAKPPIANRIAGAASDVFTIALALERAFRSAGMFSDARLNVYYSDAEEAECCADAPAEPCPFYNAFDALTARRNSIGIARSMNVVREHAVSSIAALNYVLARALYALSGDMSSAETVIHFATYNTEGYSGWSETETLFNDATAHARSYISSISHMLFGKDTQEDECVDEAYGQVSDNLFDHLTNVYEVMRVVEQHSALMLEAVDNILTV